MKPLSATNEMVVAGVMSGTSADGIDVALVRLKESQTGRAAGCRIELLGHAAYAYPKNVRSAILANMNARQASVADLARLNFLLGELYSEAILATEKKFRIKACLVGCHGQTLYHQGEPQDFLGHKIMATWQTGEGAVIAARVGVSVVSDFRPADMAAGGKGAPLVPFLDYMLFRDPRIGRIVQNIGGIANLTAIPARAAASDVIAFDTGPGNMVIDAITDELFGRRFDRGGRIAASGRVHDKVIDKVLRRKFFGEQPPKTAGREEFGREFVREFLNSCSGCRRQDIVATATALTSRSIAGAIRQFVLRTTPSSRKLAFHEMILSGGGTKNTTLVKMLTAELANLGLRVRTSDEFGLPAEAKEAVAFAVMAHETWHRRASNVPSATGAKRGAVQGKISYP
jgi:anhydro-N-acetylmuramic acid kinase